MEHAWRDLKFGLRLLLKSPGFAAVAILTLAVGIGANTAVFTIVHGVLFRGLPFDDADRIVAVASTNLARNNPQMGASYLDFLDWQTQAKAFSGLAAVAGQTASLSEPGLPTEVFPSARVTPNLFSLLGVKPLFGRDFHAEDARDGVATVAMIGYNVWQRRYGGDPKVVGRVIRSNELPVTIIGIMPEGMKFPWNNDFWIPLTVTGPSSTLRRRDVRGLIVVGRLAQGVDLARAQTEMDLIARRLEQAHPKENEGIGVRVRRYHDMFTAGTIRLLFLSMLGAVGFVLLIACANVANLLLSRAIARSREMSVRSALGAQRGRIVRQLFTESLLLSVLGTSIGFVLAVWGVRTFANAIAAQTIPYWMTFSMNYTAFAYLAGICGATSVLFGLAPALHASRVDLSQTLKEGARGTGAGRSRVLSRTLVVGEVCLALVLLVGAGLMIRSFQKLSAMSSALEKQEVLTMGFLLSGSKYGEPAAKLALLERLEPELANTPGVDAVALATTLPLWGAPQWKVNFEGQTPQPNPDDEPGIAGVLISSQYFDVLGVPIMRGRRFEPAEGRRGQKVAIVNRRFAAKYWPGEDPIGKRVGVVRGNLPHHWVTVIGEAADVKQNSGPNADAGEMEPVLYVPLLQDMDTPGLVLYILARAKGDAHALAKPLRASVQRVSDVGITRILTLPEHFSEVRWFTRLFGSLFVIFAGIGLVLAAVGIYAVIAYSARQRTHEIGIRTALGAQPGNILKLIVGQGLILTGAGIVLGVATALAVTRVMRGFLVGVTPTDPVSIAIALIALLTIAALASFIPARRAATIDPLVALRGE